MVKLFCVLMRSPFIDPWKGPQLIFHFLLCTGVTIRLQIIIYRIVHQKHGDKKTTTARQSKLALQRTQWRTYIKALIIAFLWLMPNIYYLFYSFTLLFLYNFLHTLQAAAVLIFVYEPRAESIRAL